MNAEDYALDFKDSIATFQKSSARTQSKNEGVIGASDFVCRERMRRIRVKAAETDDPDKWAAFVGTALDDKIQEARAATRPGLLYKQEWMVTLAGETFPVHPDEVDPAEPSVTDFKTKDGLALVRAGVMDDPARIQRHLQYLGGYQAGVFPAEGLTRNAVVDRSGKDQSVHVEQEEFNVEVIEQAASILRDVRYAIDNNEEASKDWPSVLCRAYCPFFTACRGGDIANEKITDPDEVALVQAFALAKETEKEAAQLQSEIRPLLEPLQGDTDTHNVTWRTKNSKSGPIRELRVTKLGRAS